LIYTSDRDYAEIMKGSETLKKKYDVYVESAKELKKTQDEYDVVYGLKIKSNYDKPKIVGGDPSNQNIETDTIKQILRNNAQWVTLLQEEIRIQQTIQANITNTMTLLNTGVEQTDIPDDKQLPTWSKWQNDIKIYLSELQKRIETFKKQAQEKVVLINAKNVQAVIPAQIKEIEYLLDMRKKDDDIIQSRLQLFPFMLQKEPLNQNENLFIQNTLQQINNNVTFLLNDVLQKQVNEASSNMEPIAPAGAVPQQMTSILQTKGNLDNLIEPFIKILNNLKRNGITKETITKREDYKRQILDPVIAILNAQNTFLSLCVRLYTLFFEYIKNQNNYISAFIDFYNELLYVREKKLVEMRKKGSAAKLPTDKNAEEQSVTQMDINKYIVENKYIEFDISCYRSLLEDNEYMEKIKEIQVKIGMYMSVLNVSIEKKYNYKEELDKWFDSPELLTLLQIQYDVYYQEILFLYEQNQETMWRILKDETTHFFDIVKKYTLSQIRNSYSLLDEYEKKYTTQERISFLNKLQESTKSIQNHSSLSFMSSFMSSDSSTFLEQKKRFLELKNVQLFAYEMITIYARVSSKEIGREISYLTVKKNIAALENGKFDAMTKYYDIVKRNIFEIQGKISFSIFWDVSMLSTNIDILMNQNRKNKGDALKQISDMDTALIDLETKYQSAIDILIPEMTEEGIVKTCNTITVKELEEEKEMVPMNENEERKRVFFTNFYTNTDPRMENFMKKQLEILLREYIYDIETAEQRNKSFYIAEQMTQTEGWRVSSEKNEPPRSFLKCIATALNGQLETEQRFTVNKYARRPFMKTLGDKELSLGEANSFMFTDIQLRELILDHLVSNERDDDTISVVSSVSNTTSTTGTIKATTYYKEALLFVMFFYIYILRPFVYNYAGPFSTSFPDAYKKIYAKVETEWNKYRYFFKRMDNPNEYYKDFETFITAIKTIMNANGKIEDTLLEDTLIEDTMIEETLIKDILIKNAKDYAYMIRKNEKYDNNEIFVFVIENVLQIKIVTMNTYNTDPFYAYLLNYVQTGSQLITILQRPVNFISNQNPEDRKYILERGIIVECDMMKSASINQVVENTSSMLDIIKCISILETFQEFLYEKYRFYEKTQNLLLMYIKNVLYHLFDIIHTVKINSIFVTELVDKLITDLIGITQNTTMEGVKKNWEKKFTGIKEEIDDNTITPDILKQADPSILWLSIMISFKKKVLEMGIVYTIQKENFERVRVSSERIMDWTQPILNVSEPFYYSNSELFGDTNIPNKEWKYMFLLYDNESSLYYNVYNEKNPSFLFSLDNVPTLFQYLLFKYFYKINDNPMILFSYYFHNIQCHNKMNVFVDKYNINNKAKRDSIILPEMKSLTPTERYRLEKENKELLEIEAIGPLVQKGGEPHTASNYTSSKYNANIQSTTLKNNESNLSYYVIVDLELYPGKDAIPFATKVVLGCQHRYEMIRKSWANLFGTIYLPSELYLPNYVPPSNVTIKKGGFFTKKINKWKQGFLRRTRRVH